VAQVKADVELCCPALPCTALPCPALLYFSTRADIFKSVKHRKLRCSVLRGLPCKTVSITLRGSGESRRRTVLPCPTSQLALTQTCESQKPALLCSAWAALPASQCAPYLTVMHNTLSHPRLLSITPNAKIASQITKGFFPLNVIIYTLNHLIRIYATKKIFKLPEINHKPGFLVR
jgi:hypothetical protein